MYVISLLLPKLFVMFCNKQLQLFGFYYHFLLIWDGIIWNIGEDRKLFLNVKSKLRLHQDVLTTTKTSAEKNTLALVEMQQSPEIEKVDSKNEILCLKWAIYNGERKVSLSFETDMDKLNVVVHRYRNNTNVKDTKMKLKLTYYEKLLSTRVYWRINYWVTSTHFLGGALYWMKQPFRIKVNFIKNGCNLSSEHFQNLKFSTIALKKSISKRVLLLGRELFLTGGGPKNFARWKDWLWILVLGLCISLHQSIQAVCIITR